MNRAPTSFVDPKTGAPAFGGYVGPLPSVEFRSAGFGARLLRRKRWVYAAIKTDEVWIALGVVKAGYASTVFGFAYDFAAQRMLEDMTAIGPVTAAQIADDNHANGLVASFGFLSNRLHVERDGDRLSIRAKLGALDLEAETDESAAPPSVCAIARLGEGLASATEKRALLAVTGRARCAGRALELDGGVGGYDYTHGIMPRNTKWRWAFALGKDESGAPFAFNVVEGFVGQVECAAFSGGAVHSITEPHFDFDVADPMRAWHLRSEGIDLTFTPGAVHAQNTNLVLVKSRFVQPVGMFTGTILDRRVVDLPGVVEDQDVLW